MGNCGLSGQGQFKHVVKLVHSNGLIEEFFRSLNAGELLIDYPDHFICHADTLSRLMVDGSSALLAHLSAEDDMEIGEIYFLLPKQMLNEKPSQRDIAALISKASKARKASYRGSQLGPLPLPAIQGMYGYTNEDDDDGKGEENEEAEESARRRAFMQRLLEEVKLQVENRTAAGPSSGGQAASNPELKSAYTSHMLAKTYLRLWRPPLDTIDEDASVAAS